MKTARIATGSISGRAGIAGSAIVRGCALAALALVLASCGGRQPLKPLEGQKPAAVPVGADAAPTAAQLTEPSVQSRPERNVELLTQSRERADDPFDLPPEADPR